MHDTATRSRSVDRMWWWSVRAGAAGVQPRPSAKQGEVTLIDGMGIPRADARLHRQRQTV